MVAGRAPTERRIAISRRRSLSVVRIIVTMPSSAVATTMAETAVSAVSATPTRSHSSCSAAPGRIADSGSRGYSLMARCSRNVASCDLRPISAAVIAFGCEVHLAHLVGADRLAGHARAALPVDVDRLDRLQADVHRAVDRRAGLLQDAGDAERLVVVLDERDRAEPVRDDDLVADLVAERLRDVGADHRVEQVGERLARARTPARWCGGSGSA